jgi:hypothetical protein
LFFVSWVWKGQQNTEDIGFGCWPLKLLNGVFFTVLFDSHFVPPDRVVFHRIDTVNA